jgi:hypothetical protein
MCRLVGSRIGGRRWFGPSGWARLEATQGKRLVCHSSSFEAAASHRSSARSADSSCRARACTSSWALQRQRTRPAQDDALWPIQQDRQNARIRRDLLDRAMPTCARGTLRARRTARQRAGLSQVHADLTSARTSLSEAGAMRLAGLELDRVRRARSPWSANPRSGGADGEPPGQQNNCANPKQRLVPHASALLSAGDRYARAARSLSLARTLSTHIECCASARSAGTRSNKHRVHARWIGKRRSIGIHVHH